MERTQKEEARVSLLLCRLPTNRWSGFILGFPTNHGGMAYLFFRVGMDALFCDQLVEGRLFLVSALWPTVSHELLVGGSRQKMHALWFGP